MVYAWKDGDSFCASLTPKDAGGAVNRYASPTEVLKDAQARSLLVQWDNPAEIDAWRRR